MKEKIGIGIVGLGWVCIPYIKSFLRNDLCSIRALCTRNPEKGALYIDRFGLKGCKVFFDLEPMLEKKDVDVVSILTPNFMHARQAVQCAEAGKSIILEKPVALNLEEVRTA